MEDSNVVYNIYLELHLKIYLLVKNYSLIMEINLRLNGFNNLMIFAVNILIINDKIYRYFIYRPHCFFQNIFKPNLDYYYYSYFG